MGQRKRKQQHYQIIRTKVSDSNANETTKKQSFTEGEIDVARDYLLAYRIGCYHPSHRLSVSDQKRFVAKHVETSSSSSSSSSSSPSYSGREEVRIGGHSFPVLTEEVLSRPYIALPRTLSSKERARIHELCVDLDLYHCGVGPNRESRYIVISPYSDGFHHVPELLAAKASTIGSRPRRWSMLRTCRPWIARRSLSQPTLSQQQQQQQHDEKNDKDNEEDETRQQQQQQQQQQQIITKNAKDEIWKLVDHPENCLRDQDRDILMNAYDGHHHHHHHHHNDEQNDQHHDTKEQPIEDLSGIEEPHNGDGQWMMVDTADKMKLCVRQLHDAPRPCVIGFDLELYNPSKFLQVTCLLQLCSIIYKHDGDVDGDGDAQRDADGNTDSSSSPSSSPTISMEYVIDPLADGVWDQIGLLRPLFADPTIVKVGHGIGGLDVSSLHRDFGIFIHNAFDTLEAAKVLCLDGSLNLAALCAHYGARNSSRYADLKAAYQMADWRIRPLTGPMIQYGRSDVRYLLPLRKLLMRDLVRQEALGDAAVAANAAVAGHFAASLQETILAMERDDDNDTRNDHDADRNPDRDHHGPTDDINDVDVEGTEYLTPKRRREDKDVDMEEEDATVRTSLSLLSSPPMEPPLPLVPKEMRLHAGLMKVITISQQRCLRFWTSKQEPLVKSAKFTALMKKVKNGQTTFSPFQMTLLEDLGTWRNRVSQREECLPGMVCPSDLMVKMAWKRPRCQASLRRISYELPELLDDDDDDDDEQSTLGSSECPPSSYRAELLAMIRWSVEAEAAASASASAIMAATRPRKYLEPPDSNEGENHRGSDQTSSSSKWWWWNRPTMGRLALLATSGLAVGAVLAHRYRKPSS